MSKAIQERLLESLPRREAWEEKQRVWYEMLRQGIPRKRKPYPGAADLHLPIADNAIEKLKPYYTNSVFSRQVLAAFTPLDKQDAGIAVSAAECLDWKLRKESNFPLEFGFLNHLMLGCGRAVMKCRWNPEARNKRGRLEFDAIDPLYFIAQAEHTLPDDMDLFCHIRQVSVAAYKRNQQFNQSEDLIERIRGGDKQKDQWKETEKEFREGITASCRKDVIVIWEAWERVEKGWRVRTFSPSAPDEPIRPPFLWDLKWQGEALQPFVTFQPEITEKGWYAPRGTVEKVAPFETYATKLWNSKADWLDYCNKPLFTREADAAIGNSINVQLAPGAVLPPGLAPASMPVPPFAIDEEINNIRALAEESVQLPDFGVTPEGDKKDSRTATEMQYIGSFASQGIQYRSWINGLFEGEVYKRAWAYLVKFGGKELTYYTAKTQKVLPEQAIHDNYIVEPDATPDGWDKGRTMQRAVGRFAMFKGHPNIRQDELAKTVLEADDARLVKRLFIDTGSKAADEAEDEAIEIGILLQGYPAAAQPGENHQQRLQILFGKIEEISMMPPPSTPFEGQRLMKGMQRMQEHAAMHLQLLRHENPQLAKQFDQAIAVMGGGTQTATLGPGAGPVGEQAPPQPQLPQAETMPQMEGMVA